MSEDIFGVVVTRAELGGIAKEVRTLRVLLAIVTVAIVAFILWLVLSANAATKQQHEVYR